MNYREALSWIHSLGRFGSRLGLERIRRLLDLLGNPHSRVPIIHVGGTNGKGSVTALTASVLESAGYRTGRYTSPYLEDFRERIVLGGQMIGRRRMASLTAKVRQAAERMVLAGEDSPTEFEVVTALGFLYFAEEAADFVCLEVGLGGRADATNVVETPRVVAITTIGLDHTRELGDTPESIAGEKAGIIKAGCPVVTGVTAPGPLAVLEDIARLRGAPLYRAGRDFRWEAGESRPGGQTFSLWASREYAGLGLALAGPHQLANAAVAVVCAEILEGQGVVVGEAAIREGLAAVRWPGRLELIEGSPGIVLDAAHNREGAAALGEALNRLWPGRRKVLVMGVLADKDAPGMLAELVPRVEALICCRPLSPRALAPSTLAGMASSMAGQTVPILVEEAIPAALRRALRVAGREDLVVVAGSLYLVGAARHAVRRLGYPVDG
ncbi:MAG: folylpolyglutamate synthase/dihydrofolate synthase family protein [bacterium]|nr:folylpolyglutamate synthase/dihydrofolate synthase family protein [bacterium]